EMKKKVDNFHLSKQHALKLSPQFYCRAQNDPIKCRSFAYFTGSLAVIDGEQMVSALIEVDERRTGTNNTQGQQCVEDNDKQLTTIFTRMLS
ncbi:hypothetical protein ACTXT7_008278, partial [Hymenolepis weldensis]